MKVEFYKGSGKKHTIKLVWSGLFLYSLCLFLKWGFYKTIIAVSYTLLTLPTKKKLMIPVVDIQPTKNTT